LINNQYKIYNCARGTAQKNLDIEEFKSIKIPIPSIEKQEEIVDFLDKLFSNTYIINDVIKYYSENNIFKLLLNGNFDKFKKLVEWQYQETELLNQIVFFKNRKNRYLYLNSSDEDIKTLGEVCEINPKNMGSLKKYTSMNYIDISSVKKGKILEIQNLINNFPSRAKRIIKKEDILYSSVRPNLKGYVYISNEIQNGVASTGFALIRLKKTNIILSKYIYYIMTSFSITDELISKAKGAQYPAVSFDDFEKLKIPIPSLEKQEEIVKYCEFNEELIKQLEKEIENNKKQARMFINCIINKQDGDSLIQNLTENDSENINEVSE